MDMVSKPDTEVPAEEAPAQLGALIPLWYLALLGVAVDVTTEAGLDCGGNLN